MFGILNQVGNEDLNPKEGLSQFAIMTCEMKKRINCGFWREMNSLDPWDPVQGAFLLSVQVSVVPLVLPLHWNINIDHCVFQQTSLDSLHFCSECHFLVLSTLLEFSFFDDIDQRQKRHWCLCIYCQYVPLRQAVSLANKNEVQETQWPLSANVAFWHLSRQKEL